MYLISNKTENIYPLIGLATPLFISFTMATFSNLNNNSNNKMKPLLNIFFLICAFLYFLLKVSPFLYFTMALFIFYVCTHIIIIF